MQLDVRIGFKQNVGFKIHYKFQFFGDRTINSGYIYLELL